MQPPLIIKGWKLFFHPLFIDQLEKLLMQVESLRQKDPSTYKTKNSTKRLAAIRKLVLEPIPEDPTNQRYRLGDTLGPKHTHWFRAKFYQQYRLFFRFNQPSKIIVFAWVNDENCLRAYESKTDAYKIFEDMLNDGNPPTNWDALYREVERETERLNQFFKDEDTEGTSLRRYGGALRAPPYR